MKKLIIYLGLLIVFFGCSDPLSYEYEGAFIDKYIVHGYVLNDSLPVYGKIVYIYIKDYKYQTWETTFTCQTTYEGRYRFSVDYDPWNFYYYDLSVDYKKVSGRIELGQIDRVDFNF